MKPNLKLITGNSNGASQKGKAKAPERTPERAQEKAGLYAKKIKLAIGGKQILSDVSLHLKKGEKVALLGANGAGKTTLFSVISGLLKPDYGEVWLNKQRITPLPMYQRGRLGIGYLPQESSIFRGLSVEQNIQAVLEIVLKSPAERRARLEELMGEFSITHLRKARAVALSGGERRRVEIARCLAASPSYILLDEPLAGIDPISLKDVGSLISHLTDRGIGVLISDHNVREALELVDRSYIIHSGRVLKTGTADEIIGDEQVRRAYLGSDFRI